jgi:hypothetical protein
MFSFNKISRAELLTITGWSSADLDNRVHANQAAFAYGCRLPTSAGAYVGADAFALRLTDALVQVGLARALAARCVLEGHQKWLDGLERVEWPELHPPPVPFVWAPTKRALDEGIAAPPPDANIYFAIARRPDGGFETASGTLLEIVAALMEMICGNPAGAPTHITQVNLKQVYEATLAAAEKAGVDLGAPFTRPAAHPEHRDWFAAVRVHCALSHQRQKARKPPGPARTKGKAGKPRTRGQDRATKSAMVTAE